MQKIKKIKKYNYFTYYVPPSHDSFHTVLQIHVHNDNLVGLKLLVCKYNI